MVRVAVLFASILVCAVVLTPSPAPATDNRPPLPLPSGLTTCKCAVQNYGAVDDGGVKIVLFDGAGNAAETCGPNTNGARRSTGCAVSFEGSDTCGCQVTGEGVSSRTSLSLIGGDGNAVASVQCK